MTITPVTLNNTFDEWRVKTNQLITQYDQTNQLAVASFNYANSTVSTSANVTANILASNTTVLTIISDTTELLLPNVIISNTTIRTMLYDNANNYIDTLNLASTIASNSYFVDSVGTLILPVVTSNVLANSVFIKTTKDSANSYVDSLNITANIIGNTQFTNTIAAAISSNVSNAIISNTSITNQIYTNANTIAYDFITSTNVGAVLAQANAAYAQANAAITTVDEDTANSTRYITFIAANSGTSNTLSVSSSKLTFNPNTGILSVTVLNSTSDINQKTDIVSINNPISTIDQMRGVGFTWKDNGTKSYGVIAQEIEKILPELVNEVDGIKSVNYSGIIAFLIEAVKELETRLEKLENK